MTSVVEMGITAVVNQKGGVGKTTVTLGLAAAVAELGGRVLVVDMDPQANSTTGLGVWDAKETIDRALTVESRGSIGPVVRASSWSESTGSVDVAPSSPGLSQLEHHLATDAIGGQDRLAVALEGVTDRYDIVLIDCPPSLGLLTVNALFAADRVLIVAEPAAWSADGVDQILRNVSRIAERRGGRPEIAGIVVNRLGRTRDGSHWYGQLSESHPELVLEPPVRLRAAVAEASAQGLPINALARSGAAESADEFRQLVMLLEPERFGTGEESPTSVPVVPEGIRSEPSTTTAESGESTLSVDESRMIGTREKPDGQVRPEATQTDPWRR